MFWAVFGIAICITVVVEMQKNSYIALNHLGLTLLFIDPNCFYGEKFSCCLSKHPEFILNFTMFLVHFVMWKMPLLPGIININLLFNDVAHVVSASTNFVLNCFRNVVRIPNWYSRNSTLVSHVHLWTFACLARLVGLLQLGLFKYNSVSSIRTSAFPVGLWHKPCKASSYLSLS